MTYPAVQLINRSWQLSGIVARDLETVAGSQGLDGLFLLNALLDFKATDVRLIPYYKRQALQLIQGQEEYFVPGLFALETMTFNIGPVRYPMTETNRDKYFGSGRVDNIQSIPFCFHSEREKDGSRVYVYYLPMAPYLSTLNGKFGLTNVTLNQDMSLVYDMFYIEYLRYALAQFMCNEYDITFAPDKLKMLMTYEKKLQDVSPADLTMQKTNFINSRKSLDWQQINLGRGFYP